MSAFLTWSPLARRGRVFLPRRYKDFLLLPRLLHRTSDEPEADVKRERKKEAAVPVWDRPPHYNPNLHRSAMECDAAAVVKAEVAGDKRGFVDATPYFRQQVNHKDVGASRHPKQDFVFNKSSVDKMPGQYSDSRGGQPLEDDDNNTIKIKISPRAFQKCRPEYASTMLDVMQKRTVIDSKRAFRILLKAEGLEGSLAAADVVKFLRELGHLRSPWFLIGDPRFAALLQHATEHLQRYSHPQLLQVLESFVWLNLPQTLNSLFGTFEQELIRRVPEMSLQQLMLAADLCRCLRAPVPAFLQRVYDSINLSLQHIGVAEIVQLFYILGEGRHCPGNLLGPVEEILMHHVHELEPEEVGAVCLGLFKSKISLSQSSVARLVDQACSVVEGMSDLAMVNVFKLLRFSHLDHQPWLAAATREVPQRVGGMDVMGLMHVTLGCSALHYRNETILMAVAARLPSVADHCRSKDTCKMLWSYGTLGILPSQCPEFYSSLLSSMRCQLPEFQTYPEHLLSGLLGLAFVGQFPEDLIAFALSPEFVRIALKITRLKVNNDLFTLDGTVGLELPKWKGPRLDVRIGEEAAACLWEGAQSGVCLKPEVLEAERLLSDLLGGRQFVRKRMILPHTRTIDLEVHLDSAGNPLPINTCLEAAVIPAKSLPTGRSHGTAFGVQLTDDLLAQLISGTQKTAEGPSGVSPPSPLPAAKEGEVVSGKTAVKLAIQLSNRNHYCYHSEQLLGLHALKRRQLTLAGYQVVELRHWEWFPLLRKRQADKLAYLHCKIFGSVD